MEMGGIKQTETEMGGNRDREKERQERGKEWDMDRDRGWEGGGERKEGERQTISRIRSP